jgi:hypothetical protein
MTAAYTGKIRATWSTTASEIERTFALWGVPEWQVRPMRELDKREHWPASEAKVTVDFVLRGDAVSLSCGAQRRYFENFRVLYYAVEAMRMNELRGLTNIMRDAYAQLSAPSKERDPFEVLGVRSDAPVGVAEAAYRELAKSAHPDMGGSTERMQALNAAIEAVRGRA